MCGILGLYRETSGRPQIDRERFAAALDTLSHRGPDDAGTFYVDTVALGHRRLSIQDLSPAAHQPMKDPSGQVAMIFNGQIYNHRDFRPELGQKGWTFTSTGDTETVLALYMAEGPECFSRLRGMWSIVIWDGRSGKLVVSRDRLGIKPLYTGMRDGGLAFASEIKALLALDGASAAAHGESLRKYMARGWLDDTPQTLFEGIENFPAATTRVYADGKCEKEISFWTPPVPTQTLHDSKHLRRALIEAVECHLLSDAPLASTLSGGIDSTGIVCIMARELGLRNIKTFTVLADDIPDESPLVEITKRETGVDHEYINIQGVDYVSALDDLIRFHDEPTFSVGQVNQFIFRREIARQGYKVLLVGDGADEVCAGYAKIIPMYLHSLLSAGMCAQTRAALKGSLALTGNTLEKQIARQRLFHRNRMGARTIQEFRFGYELIADQDTMRDADIFPPATYPQVEAISQGRALFTELMDRFRVDIPQVLRNEDRNGMAHGLEVRPVYLDHVFHETMWKYPFAMFMEGGRNKAVLRDALAGIVPDEILSNRRKFVRPGNVRSLIYKTIRSAVETEIARALDGQPGLWRGDLPALFARDCESADENNALVWFRFYMLCRWAALKTQASPVQQDRMASARAALSA